MSGLLEQLVNGLTLGSQYALVAAGLALIFGVLEIVNFAHGELVMVGAYLLYAGATYLGLPYPVAALGTVAGMVIFGIGFYLAVVHRILHRGWQVQLVATLAVSIVLINLAIVVEGSLPKTVFSELSVRTVDLGGVTIATQRLVVLGATGITFAALVWFLHRTRTGQAMRALAQNREAAVVVGLPAARIGLVTVAIAAAMAGVAAATITPLYSASPTMGTLLAIKAFAAVIMGGFGNVTGAVLSGFVLGISEALAIGYISSAYADVIVFSIMIAVLLVRPHGLFGRVVRA
ncbi:branched-chain amino acid ABC transporter permease [Plantactinospora sp. GCM10030261]|uniref:branched-chain amino acid ABC transporter permease n=1 Tax=Plantactinospora sp. GCM10030261 TaxID=3273420 RepID=UPI003613B5D5